MQEDGQSLYSSSLTASFTYRPGITLAFQQPEESLLAIMDGLTTNWASNGSSTSTKIRSIVRVSRGY
jgi:hypothetical protein